MEQILINKSNTSGRSRDLFMKCGKPKNEVGRSKLWSRVCHAFSSCNCRPPFLISIYPRNKSVSIFYFSSQSFRFKRKNAASSRRATPYRDPSSFPSATGFCFFVFQIFVFSSIYFFNSKWCFVQASRSLSTALNYVS